jgi:hypothetical protein
MTRVQELLRELGQILRPMQVAARNGQTVLAYSEHFGLIAVRWIDTDLPKWVEVSESRRGFIDRAFIGWYDPSTFRPLEKEELTRLLVAFIDDLRAEKRDDLLNILDTPVATAISNDNPKES